jgi:hypothetical protein
MTLMTRKEFFGSLAALAGGIVVLAACGSGDNKGTDASSTAGNCLANGTAVTILTNHGHVMMVSKADVAAGVDKTYDIMGTADHTHSVTVTAANFATLATNQMVMQESTVTDAHMHGIQIVCS